MNPLGLYLGRVGANFEYLPSRHHALALDPFVIATIGAGSKTTYKGVGAELGYRYYTGDYGAHGFYFGPSVFAMNVGPGMVFGNPETSGAFRVVYGAAFDVGFQHVAQDGLTIGVGVGAQYFASFDADAAASGSSRASGVLPRLLFTVGKSF